MVPIAWGGVIERAEVTVPSPLGGWQTATFPAAYGHALWG
jgi:hypothetical protein